MNHQARVVAFLLALVLGAGCDRGTPKTEAVAPRGSSTSKTFTVKGVVRKVDAQAGEVTIAHEEIVGFMPKMTMPFSLKDRTLLEDVQPGDEVEGPLKVDFQGGEVKDIELTDLTVTKPAEAVPSTASLPTMAPAETLKPGDLVPDFSVTTQSGSTLKLSDLKGQVVVLTFIYTRCPSPEFCPAIDAKFADLARRIYAVPGRADRVRLLSVSFDPEHDTPEVLAAHAARRGAKPPLWTFAVASTEELGKIGGPLGLTYLPGTREIDHNLRTAVIGPDGRLALLEAGQGWTPADILKTTYAMIPSPRK
jgi:protein SCO1/2